MVRVFGCLGKQGQHRNVSMHIVRPLTTGQPAVQSEHHFNKLAKATGVVVHGCLCIAKCLQDRVHLHQQQTVAYNNIIFYNNNFIVQFIEWKYILHFGGYIKTQYLSHVVTHVYSKIKHINM